MTVSTHRYDRINPLTNPVFDGDRIISESGQVFIVRQTMGGEFLLKHPDGFTIINPTHGQVNFQYRLQELANL